MTSLGGHGHTKCCLLLLACVAGAALAGKCDQCQHCKCDKQCNCIDKPRNKCDQCQHCKCDKQCNCIDKPRNKCDQCQHCKCDKQCNCIGSAAAGSAAAGTPYTLITVSRGNGEPVLPLTFPMFDIGAFRTSLYRTLDIVCNPKTYACDDRIQLPVLRWVDGNDDGGLTTAICNTAFNARCGRPLAFSKCYASYEGQFPTENIRTALRAALIETIIKMYTDYNYFTSNVCTYDKASRPFPGGCEVSPAVRTHALPNFVSVSLYKPDPSNPATPSLSAFLKMKVDCQNPIQVDGKCPLDEGAAKTTLDITRAVGTVAGPEVSAILGFINPIVCAYWNIFSHL